MKILPKHFLGVFIIILFLPFTDMVGQQRHERDSLRLIRDSLVNLIRIKDSLLLRASLDSLYQNNLITILDKENDSLQLDIRTMILKDKIDSVQQRTMDSINTDFNRFARWGLRDSLYNIDEDSVRRSLDALLGVVFNDKAQSPEPEKLRKSMSRLFYHLANDSLYFYIINGQNDTVPFVMKKNHSDSIALFLVNNKKDSVKVFLYGSEKSSIFMWADDDFRLAQMLKKKASPDLIHKEWANLARIKIPHRKVPATPPKLWKTGGDVDIRLNQMAFSHWAKGGTNKISLLTKSQGFANYSKGKISWNNDYLYRYGVLKSEGLKLYKNIEQLSIKTSFYHQAFKNYYYSFNSQFDSQLFPGYSNPSDSIPVSKFMGPAILTTGLGMVYIPTKEFAVTVDPLSGKFTFVLDTVTIKQKKYGLREDQRVKSEIGTKIYITYKKVLWKNINLNTSLGLFRSYVNNPKPDIDWVTDIGLKVNKYLSTKFYLYMKYDDDMIIPEYDYVDGKRTQVGEGKFLQLQQTFGVTFTFYL